MNLANEPKLKVVNILLVGSRYTGKGQIGRFWGRTPADLPTLQPVILYDRTIEWEGTPVRVIAWVLSFDPEFEDIRGAFYKKGDGLILTFDLCNENSPSLNKLDQFLAEIKAQTGRVPHCILVGTKLSEHGKISQEWANKIREWIAAHETCPTSKSTSPTPRRGLKPWSEPSTCCCQFSIKKAPRKQGLNGRYNLFT